MPGRVVVDRPVDATASAFTTGLSAAIALTFTGSTGYRFELAQVIWSYSTTPTGGGLRVETPSGTTVLDFDITLGGPGHVDLSGAAVRGASGATMVVRLLGTVGTLKLNAYRRKVPG